MSENQFLYEQLHAFYTAILTSCYRHDVNNVKDSRNSGDLAPKLLTFKTFFRLKLFILQQNFDF